MKRLFFTMAAMLFAASVANAQTMDISSEEDAAVPSQSEVPRQSAEELAPDTSDFYPEDTNPDKYKEPVKWGVNPLIKQIDGDHSLGLKQPD